MSVRWEDLPDAPAPEAGGPAATPAAPLLQDWAALPDAPPPQEAPEATAAAPASAQAADWAALPDAPPPEAGPAAPAAAPAAAPPAWGALPDADFNPARMGVRTSLAEFGKGIVRGVEQIPRFLTGLGRMAAEKAASDVLAGMPGSDSVVGDFIGKYVTNEALERIAPGLMQKRKEVLNRTADFFKRADDWFKRSAQTGWEAPRQTSFQEAPVTRSAQVVGEAVPMFATAAALSYYTKSHIPAGMLFGMYGAADTYNEARDAGASVEKARLIATLDGVWQGVSESIPFQRLLGRTGRGAIERILKGALTEGVQELSQDVISNLIQKYGYDPERAAYTWDQALSSLVGGAILGGAAGGVFADPVRIDIDMAEQLLTPLFGPGAQFQRINPTTLAVRTRGGDQQVLQFVPSAADLAAEDPEAFLDSVQKLAPAEARAALDAAAAANPGGTREQQRAAAAAALRAQFGPVAVTTPGDMVLEDAKTGKRTPVDALIQVVAGETSAGTLTHEQLHAYAILAGLRSDGSTIVDPDTGRRLSEEELARALEDGTDHPITQKFRDMGLAITNLFRVNKRENLYRTARRILAYGRRETQQQLERDELEDDYQARGRAARFDPRAVEAEPDLSPAAVMAQALSKADRSPAAAMRAALATQAAEAQRPPPPAPGEAVEAPPPPAPEAAPAERPVGPAAEPPAPAAMPVGPAVERQAPTPAAEPEALKKGAVSVQGEGWKDRAPPSPAAEPGDQRGSAGSPSVQPQETVPFRPRKGQRLLVVLQAGEKGKPYAKPHDGVVVQVLDDQTVRMKWRPPGKGTFVVEDMPISRLAEPANVRAMRMRSAKLAGLTPEQRRQVTKDSREFNRLLWENEPFTYGEDAEKVDREPSQRMQGIAKSRHLRAARAAAADLMGARDLDLDDPNVQAELLPKLREIIAAHRDKAEGEGIRKRVAEIKNAAQEPVMEQDLEEGSLVYRDGEWYRVSKPNGLVTRMEDGRTIEVEAFDTVDVAGVVRPGDPAYRTVEESYAKQRVREVKAQDKQPLELEPQTRESLEADAAREAEQEEARARRAEVEERQAAPLRGGTIDTTGDLFDQNAADNPLFAPPPPRGADARNAVRRLMTPELDRLYLAAVERGDMETARDMVDEAAKQAGFMVGPVWHGSGAPFHEFDVDQQGSGYSGTVSENEPTGFHFTDDLGVADYYAFNDTANFPRTTPLRNEDGSGTDYDYEDAFVKSTWVTADDAWGEERSVGQFYLKIDKPAVVERSEHRGNVNTALERVRELLDEGNDGVILNGVRWDFHSVNHWGPNTQYIVADPKQIKSGSIITRDGAGRIIPLSERFNPESTDIRNAVRRRTPNRRQFAEGAEQSDAVPPPQQFVLSVDPRGWYRPQSFRAITETLGASREADLINRRNQGFDLTNPAEGDENDAVAAGIELINRRLAAGEDATEDILWLARRGTAIGQLLHQYSLFYSSTPAGAVRIAEALAEEQGKRIPRGQLDAIAGAARQAIAARDAMAEAEEAYLADPTTETAKRLDAARKAARIRARSVANLTAESVPPSWAKLYRLAMQGSVLTPASQVANIVGNIVNQPLRGMAQTIAGVADRVESFVSGAPRTVLAPSLAGEAAAVRGVMEGLGRVGEVVRNGSSPDAAAAGEIQHGFQPLRAWVQAFTGEGLAVDKRTGEVRFNDRAKKLFEATFGIAPEIMFRGLSVGDLPFRAAAYNRHLAEIGQLRGYSGADLEAFIKAPDAEAARVALARARVDIYQNDSPPAKVAALIGPSIDRMGPVAEWVNTILLKPALMFVKTPSNILWEADQYLNPVHGLAAAIMHGARGDRREMNLAIGRMGVGAMMYAAGLLLVKLGLVSGKPERDPKARALQYQGLSPLRVNVSGLARWRAGGDPAWQTDDRTIDYRNLGYMGLVLNVLASSRDNWLSRAARSRRPVNRAQAQPLSAVIAAAAVQYPSAMLDLSMMKGTANLLDAVQNNEYESWLVRQLETIATVPLPNTVRAMNKATQTWMVETRVDLVGVPESLANIVRLKTWSYADLPTRRNMWGERIPQTPSGSNPWVYNLVSTLKTAKVAGDSVDREIWDLYTETSDKAAIPSIPAPVLAPPSALVRRGLLQPVELTPSEYERLVEWSGRLRKGHVVAMMRDPGWAQAPVVDRIDRLNGAYEAGLTEARMRLSVQLERQGRFRK